MCNMWNKDIIVKYYQNRKYISLFRKYIYLVIFRILISIYNLFLRVGIHLTLKKGTDATAHTLFLSPLLSILVENLIILCTEFGLKG